MKKQEIKINRFGENLKNILAVVGWTQQQLADKLCTTQQCISHWINGDREPSLDALILVSHFLDEDPNELLGFNDLRGEDFSRFEDMSQSKK